MVRQVSPSSNSVVEILEKCAADYLRQSEEATPNLSACAKLYTASSVLLAATQNKQVVPALVEICSNLLACEELAVVEVKRHTRSVCVLAEENLSPDQRRILTENPDVLDKWITPGKPAFSEHQDVQASAHLPLTISAVVPLWRDQNSSAAIVLLRLLPQRTEFDAEDREVLQFLSAYAGRCLQSQSRRAHHAG